MHEPATKPDEFEIAADEAIAACGSARAAVVALLVENAQLADELASAVPAISYGYSRGRYGYGMQGTDGGERRSVAGNVS